ncbi:MAG: 3H domain-containing protein, partial [Oscillospiraceae bacterium]
MWSLDRFEGDFAVCIAEDQRVCSLPRAELPDQAREGDLLELRDGRWMLNRAETDARRAGARRPRMSAETRRHAIERALSEQEPISASALAERFSVSRQLVVGDIALLRAAGAPVVATPRGYLLRRAQEPSGVLCTVACRHTAEQITDELYAAVDQGCTVLDVIVEHPVYGQISGQLQISSRYDVDRFVQALAESNAPPLSLLTGGIHLHTLRCPDEASC